MNVLNFDILNQIVITCAFFFRYAKYLELMNLPDEMRELLDEYLDANSRADQQKDCAEFFQCPFSIHDTMKRSEPTNSILN